MRLNKLSITEYSKQYSVKFADPKMPDELHILSIKVTENNGSYKTRLSFLVMCGDKVVMEKYRFAERIHFPKMFFNSVCREYERAKKQVDFYAYFDSLAVDLSCRPNGF